MKGKKIVIGILVVFVIVFVGFAIKNATSSGEDETYESDVKGPTTGTKVDVATIETEDIVNTIEAEGQIDMINKGIVYSPTTAKIETANYEVGDSVVKGDVLVTFADDTLDTLVEELEYAKLDLKSGQLALSSITIQSTDSELLQLNTQLSAKADAIEAANKQVEQIDLRFETTEQQLATAKNKLNDGKILYDNGIITRKEYEELENNVTTVENSIKNLELEKNNAKASIDSAKRSYSETEAQISLVKGRSSSQAVLNQVETQKVNIEKLNLRIESLEKEIANFQREVIAEEDGIILSKNVEIGTMVQKGTTLYTTGSTSKNNLVVRVNVLEYDSGSLAIGQKATIEGNALGEEKVTGTVSKIYPTVEDKIIGNSQKKVVVTEIEVDDTDLVVRAGSSVEATIVTSINENTTVVPITSLLVDEDGADYVLIVKDDFSLEKIIVKIGTYTGSMVEVTNVTPNTKVVLNAPSYLETGSFVKYVEE